MEEPKLKPQLKLLAINYVGKCEGNIEKSAIEAGYSKTYARAQSYKLLARADVQAYICWLQRDKVNLAVKSLEEIQHWWSNFMDDEHKDSDRLRASELLAKSKGAFNNDW